MKKVDIVEEVLPMICGIVFFIVFPIWFLWYPLWHYHISAEKNYEKIPIYIQKVEIGPATYDGITIITEYDYSYNGKKYTGNRYALYETSGTLDDSYFEKILTKFDIKEGESWGYVKRNNPSRSFLRNIGPGYIEWIVTIFIHLLFIVFIIIKFKYFNFKPKLPEINDVIKREKQKAHRITANIKYKSKS